MLILIFLHHHEHRTPPAHLPQTLHPKPTEQLTRLQPTHISSRQPRPLLTSLRLRDATAATTPSPARFPACLIPTNTPQPSRLPSHSLGCASYCLSDTSRCDFMGKCDALLVNLSGSVVVTAAVSHRLMALPPAEQPVPEGCFSRTLMLILTTSFAMPRDSPPPHHLYFSSLSKRNEIPSTLLPHTELTTSPESQSHITESEKRRTPAPRDDRARHLTLLHKTRQS